MCPSGLAHALLSPCQAVAAREAAANSSFERIEAATKTDKKKKGGDDDWDTSFEDEKAAVAKQFKDAFATEGTVDDKVKALMAVAREHSLQADDMFGFIFTECLDATAAKQIGANLEILQGYYRGHVGSDRAPAHALSCVGRRTQVSDICRDTRPL